MNKTNDPKRRTTLYLRMLLLIIAVTIKFISFHPVWIEHYYSTSIYLSIASFFRTLFGRLPFSLGDMLYTAAAIYLLITLVSLAKKAMRRQFNSRSFRAGFIQFVLICTVIYVSFNILWGLNYNRLGIAYQLNLQPEDYSNGDLKEVTSLLITSVNKTRRLLDTNIRYPSWKEMFVKAELAYQSSEREYPFLHYHTSSVKRSLYGRGGNYFGFLGYYNPFTGESQLNLTQPKFLLPYVTCHEMAHQLGYASESEANFAGYLSAIHSPDALFHYSVYFDLLNYANRELLLKDSIAARANYKLLDTLVRKDFTELRLFYKKYKNPLEPIIHAFYDQYLKANQQVKGIDSYNYVIGLLISYHKKFGKI